MIMIRSGDLGLSNTGGGSMREGAQHTDQKKSRLRVALAVGGP